MISKIESTVEYKEPKMETMEIKSTDDFKETRPDIKKIPTKKSILKKTRLKNKKEESDSEEIERNNGKIEKSFLIIGERKTEPFHTKFADETYLETEN